MSNEKGQSLLEVIVAVTVGILVVSALTFATIFSLRNAGFAKASAQATKLAQEGIEMVRTGRDRTAAITGDFQLSNQSITSWDDPDLWAYRISINCTPNCYFNINSSGELQYLTADSSLPQLVKTNGQFKRVVVLSDDASYQIEKKVTVIVTWTDFACGATPNCHESRLTTILRRL
ncbi:MAG: hypothetical protein NUV73_01130 [Candidatus Daviesbacteria bacterium]|nr:hypothetical protein [Candidatus Daviesbacteria bacterium]